jgi:hypothetical protein
MSNSKYGYILVAVDIENSGWSMKDHAMTQIGAVAMESKTRKILDKFVVVVNVPKDRGWEKRCITEFYMSSPGLIELKRQVDNNEGKDPPEAMKMFVAFALNVYKKYAYSDINRIRFCTDTTSFDCGWINLYLAIYINSRPLHLLFDQQFKDVLELGSYQLGKSNVTHEEELEYVERDRKAKVKAGKEGRGYFSAEKVCLSVLGIKERPKAEHNHDALSDSTNIAEMLNIIMYHNPAKRKAGDDDDDNSKSKKQKT